MVHWLSNEVCWGDKSSMIETLGQVQSIINVAHRIRRPYWRDLERLDWGVWYFRLALPDREVVDLRYIRVLERVVKSIKEAEKTPVLCHCRMGGHRGPTCALFVYWCLGGGLLEGYERLVSLQPNFASRSDKRVYRNSMLEYMTCQTKG